MVDSNPPPGLITNVPWKLKHDGDHLCDIYQRCASARIELCEDQVSKWGVSPAELQVAITETALAILRADQQPLMQCRLWKPVEPAKSSWQVAGGGLSIQLAKPLAHYGSWPYIFQQVEVHSPPPPAPPQPTADAATAAAAAAAEAGAAVEAAQTEAAAAAEGGQLAPAPGLVRTVWSQSREAFEEEAQAQLKAWQEEMEAERAAYVAKAHALLDSVAPVNEPNLQVAFLVPSDPRQCLRVVQTSRHLPTVTKLLRLSKQVLDLEGWLDGEAATPSMLPPHVLPMLRFVAGLATIEQLREREGVEAVQAADAVGGNGCGSEYAVLVFGGVLSLPDALRMLKAHTGVLLARWEKEAGAKAAPCHTDGEALPAGEAPTPPAGASAGAQAAAPQGAGQDAAAAKEAAAEVAAAVAGVLEGVRLREPRIAVYCHSTGARYWDLDKVREWLPEAAATTGGERKVLAAWVYVGCPEIWQLEDEDEEARGAREAAQRVWVRIGAPADWAPAPEAAAETEPAATEEQAAA